MTTNSLRNRLTSRHLQALLLIIGLCVSGYLSYLKLFEQAAACVQGGPFNCGVVLNSQYSELGNVPIAYLGFAIYALLALLALAQNRVAFLREYGDLLAFGIALFAWLFSMWLVFVQFVLLQALCPWCLTHEVNFTVLFFLLTHRVYRELAAENANGG